MRASSNFARSATLSDARRRSMRRSMPDAVKVALGAMLLACFALLYSLQHGLLLLYGDAVAHLHIARRILDAQTPGFRQLGSVWLPLPHLLLLPFVQAMSWWQTGIGGALPSMLSYVAAVVALFRLAASFVRRPFAWLAAGFLALNPGLLYFSSTAMTEPLFLAEILWATLLIVLFAQRSAAPLARDQEHANQDPRGLRRLMLGASLLLIAAVFTRYDGWIYAAAAWCFTCWATWQRRNLRERLTGTWLLATVLLACAPLLWIAYNARQFHDPFDFLRGPYSARAIEQRTSAHGSGHYPGHHDMPVAWLYYLKVAELGAVPKPAADVLFALALAGTGFLAWRRQRPGLGATSLLWLPLPFYAYSVAYGSVPIFFPLWFPHSYYNTRYGMELLPAFGLFCAAALQGVADWRPRWSEWIVTVAVVLLILNDALLLRSGPLVYEEAVANARTRIPFERALATALVSNIPAGASVLMYTSEHVGAIQQAGKPLREVTNEGDWEAWHAALAHPAGSARYVVALAGDPVAAAVAADPNGLTLLQVICSTGQPCARIYQSLQRPGQP